MNNPETKDNVTELLKWLKITLVKKTAQDKLKLIEQNKHNNETIISLQASLEFILEDNEKLRKQLKEKIVFFKETPEYKQFNDFTKIYGDDNIVLKNNKGIVNIVQFGKVIDEYQELRNELNKLISIELSIKNLIELRETSGSLIKNKSKSNATKTLLYGFSIFISNHIEINGNEYQKYNFNTLEIINNLEKQEKDLWELQKQSNKLSNNDINTENNKNDSLNKIFKQIEEKGEEFKKSLLSVKRELDKRKYHLKSILIQISASISDTSGFFRNMVDRIKHTEFKEQAEIHQQASENLTSKLNEMYNSEKLMENNDYILKTIGAVGIMIDIEKRRITIERLIQLDKNKKRLTIWTVIGYIVAVISSILIFNSHLEPYLPSNKISISVLIWSLLGSVASMVLQFNKEPLNNFGEAVKWLITRPTQGVIFGAAIYLVLVAGQFFFSGNAEQNGIIEKNSEIILLIAFLVGFSDRLALSVFNTLIDKYSSKKSKSETNSNQDIKNERQ